MRRIETEIFVIGAGAAGLAAAAAAAEAGSRTLIAEKNAYAGGVLPRCIHHGFGTGYFGRDLTGPEYLADYMQEIRHLDIPILTGTTVREIRPDRSALLQSPGGMTEVHFRECVVATGCREKPLAALPVEGTRPEGIYTAGEMQELVNLKGADPGERILILGSGDIGQIMARRFCLLGKQVVGMVEIRDRLGGLERNRRECIEAFHIPVFLNATVKKVVGYPRLTATVVGFSDGRPDREIPCDTLITAMGLIPDRSLTKNLENYGNISGKTPNWLHFCGNADTVHEIVDRVTLEGERLGRQLALKRLPPRLRTELKIVEKTE